MINLKFLMQTANLQRRITLKVCRAVCPSRGTAMHVENRQLIKIEDTKQYVGPLDTQRNPKTEESTDINYCANFAERRALFTKRFHLKIQR